MKTKPKKELSYKYDPVKGEPSEVMQMEKKLGDEQDVNKVRDLKDDSDVNNVRLNVHAVEHANKQHVLYGVEDTPPWYLCILLGFQHYLTAVGSLISIPILLSGQFCMDQDNVGISELISTFFFVSGICTLLQTMFGVRLPIVQGATFAFVTPTITIMSQTACDYKTARSNGTTNFTAIGLPEVGSDGHREIWMERIREIQGAILVASLFQIFIGFSGIMGLFLRYIGPLSIAPTVTLIGLSLTGAGANLASKQWWIAIMTVVLIVVFSQYIGRLQIPIPCSKERGCSQKEITRFNFFNLFPVLLAMIVAWIVCVILTEAGALPDDPKKWGYFARTDRSTVLSEAQWFRFPYPGQWGKPTVKAANVFGILAGVLSSIVESIGDYYACARLSGAPPPPIHAMNRGIGIEGIGCIVAGAWGTGNGTTSFSQNVGAIGITKVGSRRVVQVGGILMIIIGCLGKFGALFTTIPDPVIGGMFIVSFGMVTAVGLSNLQYIDLNSPRNILILGLSLYFGLALPSWLSTNKDAIDTGNDTADQILTVLFSTSMFVGGMVGFVLDNTIPGTDEERGINAWKQALPSRSEACNGSTVYDLPFQKYFNKIPCIKYIPFCPGVLTSNKNQENVEGRDNVASDHTSMSDINTTNM